MFYTIRAASADDMRLPLKILAIGIHHPVQIILSESYQSAYKCFYCLEGDGEVFLHGRRYLIREGLGFLVFPDEPFICKSRSETWIMDQLYFDGEMCEGILNTIGIRQSEVFHFFDRKVFHLHIQKIHTMASTAPPRSEKEFSKACYDFLLDLPTFVVQQIFDVTTNRALNENELVQKTMTYLVRYFDQSFSLEELAAYVGRSKNYLCTLFKKITRRTIMQELSYIRIGKARMYLLRDPEKTVREIAHLCGYEDASYFGRVFKSIEGISPEKYRRNPKNSLSAPRASAISTYAQGSERESDIKP